MTPATCSCLRGGRPVVQYAPMANHVRAYVTADKSAAFYIDLAEGEDLDSVVNDFLNHAGRFTGDWIDVRGSNNSTHYVRYDKVVHVEAYSA